MSISRVETYLTKLECSNMVKIPNEIIKQLNLADNQELTINVLGDSIILTPIKRQATNIHELFDNWQDDGLREHESDWGESTGNEIGW
ncbi:AbrB/MazE/SpoVT family DNA-binding domain-containing protein [Lactiplantibacillus herbarum]|uniref:AbrB/MazE/SpoVT family DNA-binding domain-containing protein n=1 Tax=Lactiplantibacillus herbarum TaxID=1670446 RepID=UPI00064EF137|nr:PbsX family transcriptional regulator [Lactiplantibacillus herbarum]